MCNGTNFIREKNLRINYIYSNSLFRLKSPIKDYKVILKLSIIYWDYIWGTHTCAWWEGSEDSLQQPSTLLPLCGSPETELRSSGLVARAFLYLLSHLAGAKCFLSGKF